MNNSKTADTPAIPPKKISPKPSRIAPSATAPSAIQYASPELSSPAASLIPPPLNFTVVSSTGWKTVNDPSDNYSFQYPPDWTINKDQNGYVAAKDGNSVKFYPGQTSTGTASGGEEKKFIINLNNHRYLLYTYVSPDNAKHYTEYTIISDQKGWFVIYFEYKDADYSASYANIMYTIASTLRFTDITPAQISCQNVDQYDESSINTKYCMEDFCYAATDQKSCEAIDAVKTVNGNYESGKDGIPDCTWVDNSNSSNNSCVPK